MDGSTIGFLAQHPFVTGIAAVSMVALAMGLFQHSRNCKTARDKLHERINEFGKEVGDVKSMVAELRGMMMARKDDRGNHDG